MNKSENMNFKDPQTIVAIILVFAIFIGWNFYMRNKYPEIGKQKPPVTEVAKKEENDPKIKIKELGEPAEYQANLNEDTPVVEKVIPVKTAEYVSQISSHGLNIKQIVLNNYFDRKKENFRIGTEDLGTFVIKDQNGKIIPFEMSAMQRQSISATAKTKYGLITANMFFGDSFDFRLQINVTDVADDFDGIQLEVFNLPIAPPTGSFLMGNMETNDAYFLLNDGEEQRIDIAEPNQSSFKAASVFAIDTPFFANAYADSSPIMPAVDLFASAKNVRILAKYKPITKSNNFEVDIKGFFGPKDVDFLKSVDPRLEKTIDYGIFSFLAHPLLSLLRWAHGIFGNWGLAIIFMTLLVKLAVLPFNLMSHKSMKAMQKLQPAMQALREKYKDDPTKLNQEMMQLMKTQRVNPLGGCLPMLLQLPVFFALYQVLRQSVELYQAPFFGWITDLSVKDPFYILPVLMGVTMFFQMRMTPTTMDPNQAKIMAFMPLLFTFFMISLPSGLTLYIFISTLFTVVQQLVFMRERSQPVTAQSAKA